MFLHYITWVFALRCFAPFLLALNDGFLLILSIDSLEREGSIEWSTTDQLRINTVQKSLGCVYH